MFKHTQKQKAPSKGKNNPGEQKKTVFFEDKESGSVLSIELCSECEDHPSVIFCESCGDSYCNECFYAFHKKGNRRLHHTHPVQQNLPESLVGSRSIPNTSLPDQDSSQKELEEHTKEKVEDKKEEVEVNKEKDNESENDKGKEKNESQKTTNNTDNKSSNSSVSPFSQVTTFTTFSSKDSSISSSQHTKNTSQKSTSSSSSSSQLSSSSFSSSSSSSSSSPTPLLSNTSNSHFTLGQSQRLSWKDRSIFIPLRVSGEELVDLSLVECALTVSEYTERVDISSGCGTQGRRMTRYLKELCSIVVGLSVSRDYRRAEVVIKGKSFSSYATYLQHMFEVGRRYKITNPQKMRDTYGKLIYAMMDSQFSDIQQNMGMKCVIPIKTVDDYIIMLDGGRALVPKEGGAQKLEMEREKVRRGKKNLEWKRKQIEELKKSSEDNSSSSSSERKEEKEGNKNKTSSSSDASSSIKPPHILYFLSEMLDDPLLDIATIEIFNDKTHPDFTQRQIKEKNAAVAELKKKYSRTKEEIIEWERERLKDLNGDNDVDKDENKKEKEGENGNNESKDGKGNGKEGDNSKASDNVRVTLYPVTPDNIELIIHSLADNQSFLRYNSLPCQRMLDYLSYFFSPREGEMSRAEMDEMNAEKRMKERKKKGEYPHSSASQDLVVLDPPDSSSKDNNTSGTKKDNENDSDDEDDDNEEEESDDDDDDFDRRGRIRQKRNTEETSLSQRPGFFASIGITVASWFTWGRGKGAVTSSYSSSAWKKRSSLEINKGYGGARLSHSHKIQFRYVKQSLLLWREIVQNFFQLWILAESDLLSNRNNYRLRDTGQGMNRVQSCPRVARAMDNILSRVRKNLDENWVGSSAVHLGDANVPNAFMFIDKYTQVSRILNPIINVLDRLPYLCREHEGIYHYVCSQFGSISLCQLEILQDFFRHGFDGSGADDYFSAGSCIDGRLTSAWNWCSQIEKKKYFPVFLLCGFIGFDGEF